MVGQRLCGRCNNKLENHTPFMEYGNYVFCPGQTDIPFEILDMYQPMSNLQYLEYLYDKKISKEEIVK